MAKREHTSTGHTSYKASEFRSSGQQQAAAGIRERGKPAPGCGWDAANLLGKLPRPWAVLNGLGYLSCLITAAQCSRQAHQLLCPLCCTSSWHSQAPSREQGKADNACPRITSPTLNQCRQQLFRGAFLLQGAGILSIQISPHSPCRDWPKLPLWQKN